MLTQKCYFHSAYGPRWNQPNETVMLLIKRFQ